MLQEIAKVTGYPYDESDHITMTLLQRIASKMPTATLDEDFSSAVRNAEAALMAEGQAAIAAMAKAVTADPVVPVVQDRVLKIKSSPKGTRIKVAAPSGIRYSFGPVWNASVCSGSGFAISKNNRHKLDYQAFLHGIEGAETMDAVALCALLAPKILEQQEHAS